MLALAKIIFVMTVAAMMAMGGVKLTVYICIDRLQLTPLHTMCYCGITIPLQALIYYFVIRWLFFKLFDVG